LPSYSKEHYYPDRIGEVLNSQYQIVTKLGFGSSSTVWLCRDLHTNRYLALKIHVRSNHPPPEVQISRYLKSLPSTNLTGKRYIRLALDSFDIPGPYEIHICTLYEPAGIDIRDYIHCLEGDALPESLLRVTIRFMLIALDYLHEAKVIHTDIQPHNILLGIDDNSILAEMKEDEISDPAPRKQLSDRTIFATRGMPLTSGEPVLADLGEARLADGKGTQRGLIMPSVYRAPEVMLGMNWDSKVDIQGLGQTAWTLFEQGHLFTGQDLETDTDHARRFAEMISLLGPLPVEFLTRSQESLKFWDEDGKWKGCVVIPEQSLESRESRLQDDDKMLFLRFLRKTLSWLPDERPMAKELLMDE
ncbi:kinase domain protein, partial [Aspergillus sclerotioniger CBS 115572]